MIAYKNDPTDVTSENVKKSASQQILEFYSLLFCISGEVYFIFGFIVKMLGTTILSLIVCDFILLYTFV